jgi:SPFH domain / Band 7 family
MISRIILTTVLFGMMFLISIAFEAPAHLASTHAVDQFQNSDQSYWSARYWMYGVSAMNYILATLTFAAFISIWYAPLKRAAQWVIAAVSVLLLISVIMPNNAWAYYDKTNWPEVVLIMPNESAFFIPDTGANKDTQGAFGSEQYYRDNKIATKRFDIPHAKLPSSSYWSDYYVPTGRLILVNREPYMREWTMTHSRGTSDKNEGFPCQSKEGLNVTLEITVAASVAEEQAPKFLYHFGVKPAEGDRGDPKVVFTSIYYGRSLKEIMDTVIRGKVQSLICRALGPKSFDEINLMQSEILNQIEQQTIEFAHARGITIDYLGSAGTFHFDPDVQQALNERYRATTIKDQLPILREKAIIDAFTKWDGHLPNPAFIAIPEGMVGKATEMLQKQLGMPQK